MGRGIERKEIFIDNKDREDFIIRLSALADDGSMDIYAFALLPNHFHLLCKTKKRPLSSSMRKLLTGYAVRFNRRHKRHGHLFQNRYKSIVCQEDAYLLELVRYIHLNLLRAGIVKSMRGLNKSAWSGHSALVGHIDRKWQETKYILSFFGRGQMGRRKYLEYVTEGIERGRRPELVGGGLIRSLGGWFEVLSLRRRGEKEAYDQRILGDGDFVDMILSESEDIAKENLRLVSDRGIDLTRLAERVCKVHSVSMGEFRSGSRRRDVVKARRVLSSLAVRELGYSGAEVARYLGVTNSCITRYLLIGKSPPKNIYLRLIMHVLHERPPFQIAN
jgi:REP element-mobilizing transposase RayT